MLLFWADHEWPESAGFCARLKPDLELYQNVVSGSKQNDRETWQENQSDLLEVAVRIKIG